MVYYCTIFEEGQQLYLKNAELVSEVVPAIKNIPAIAFNGKYKPSLQNGALTNLTSSICEFFKDATPKPIICGGKL